MAELLDSLPRWRKVATDLATQKARTLLVVLSIAVGVFAVGMVTQTYIYLISSSNEGYAQIFPTSTFVTLAGFDEDLVEYVRRMPGVAEADGRRVSNARINLNGQWYSLTLSGWDFGKGRLNLIEPIAGAPIPEDRQLLLDQTTFFLTDFNIGDRALIEMSSGQRYELPIVGQVRDLNSNPSINSGGVNGYVTLDTFEWLDEPAEYNRLAFSATENQTDYDHIQALTAQVKDKIERGGWTVIGSLILPEPGVSPVNFLIEAIRIILGVMAVVCLFLSIFLVFNTMSALIVAQVKQIGIMKSIGADFRDLTLMYLVLVVIYGLAAFLIAILPAAWAAREFSQFVAAPRTLDLKLNPFQIAPEVIALQLLVSIGVPVIGALPAVMAGARITINEAISSHGLADNFGGHAFDRLLGRVSLVTRPWLLSVGNILRNKRRVLLTLGTLILGGAFFIGVISVSDSANRTVAELGKAYGFDVEVILARPYRLEDIRQHALEIPGVTSVEGWLIAGGTLINDAGEEGNIMRLVAPPKGSTLTQPKIMEGRWLVPEDENAIVIDSSLLREYPDLEVGDSIRLKISGREYDWIIVGIYQYLGVNLIYISYTNYPYIAQITNQVGQIQRIQLTTEQHDPAYQAEIAHLVGDHLRNQGIKVSGIETSSALRNVQTEQFNIVVFVLVAMALLITLVGGLGLTGTMSMSVMERNREIGVMRVLGADDGMVMRIIIVEGIVIALLSWLAAIVLAWPVGWSLSQVVGRDLVNGPLSYVYSVNGMVMWLILVLVTAAAASLAPARWAIHLTVRDVLAYE